MGHGRRPVRPGWRVVYPGPATAPDPDSGQAALASARQDQKYLFILFWKEDNAATQGVKQTLDAALARRSGQATSVLVKTKTRPRRPSSISSRSAGRPCRWSWPSPPTVRSPAASP